jgi:hypothetical protein
MLVLVVVVCSLYYAHKTGEAMAEGSVPATSSLKVVVSFLQTVRHCMSDTSGAVLHCTTLYCITL